MSIDVADGGWVTLRVPTRDGTAEREVDLFAFFNGLYRAGAALAADGRHPEALEARTRWMHENGFPGVSAGATYAALDRLYREVEEWKKKVHSIGPAGTADSTGSPSGSTTAGGTPPA